MDALNIAFFGSGPFALPILQQLAQTSSASGDFELRLVVTRPGRPSGRGRKIVETPVAELARTLDLPLESPPTVNEPRFLEKLSAFHPDLFLVADYGEILGRAIREATRIGVYNLHASLLPKYRGAAPVAHAILAGETETGVTLFRIERALDAGPVVDTIATGIRPEESAGELEERLALLAVDLVERNLPRFRDGDFSETTQDDSSATQAPKLLKEQGRIPWSRSARQVADHIRAMSPWPGAFSELTRSATGKSAQRLGFFGIRASDRLFPLETAPSPGEVLEAGEDGISVACGEGAVEILELQRPGKSTLKAAVFLRGFPIHPGDRFGESS